MLELLEPRRCMCSTSLTSPPDDFAATEGILITRSIPEREWHGWFYEPGYEEDNSGHALPMVVAKPVGDLNGDGYGDVLIVTSNPLDSTGHAALVYGSSSPLRNLEACLQAEPQYMDLGWSIVRDVVVRSDGLELVMTDGAGTWSLGWKGQEPAKGEPIEQPMDFNGDGLVDSLKVDGSIAVIELAKLPGDADENGSVEFADFLQLSRNYGAADAVWADGDFDADGLVGFSDFLLLSKFYGGSVAMDSLQRQADQTNPKEDGKMETRWNLDTGNDGHDEAELVGTLDQVTADVMHHHNLVEWPEHWELKQVDA